MGLFELPWWGYALVALGLTHVTIAAVTIFLHRHQAHHALGLHPLVSHFFRFWLWLTTGMVTRQWVAVHRKHHAKCETPEDPHSPQVYGIRRVLFEGAELYRAAVGPDLLATYGRGTPDDWLERHVYGRHNAAGVSLLLVVHLVLFGAAGLTVWAIQMLWIPVFAAGVINGIGHWWGYRNFTTRDASRNILPWGILIGGEELHNNHHAYAGSARLSNRWWEFDLGWAYIRLLQALRLAEVHKLAPQLRFRRDKTRCDLETVQAIAHHRFDVLARYARSLRRTVAVEVRRQLVAARRGTSDGGERQLVRPTLLAIRHALQTESGEAPADERALLARALDASPVLQTIYAMRRELAAVWERSAASAEERVGRLEDWCRRAEASGIAALAGFSRTLRSYA